MHSDEFDWVESCKDLAKKKLRSKLPEGKEKEKILRFLSYRGFNYEIIKSALNNLD
jgi:SOS response regulatory protein OraA/RecX